MSENRTSLEIIAPSVEEAIEKGLSELGLSRQAVDVEILDEGSRGLFRIGSRQARIRLTIIGYQQPAKTYIPAETPVEIIEETEITTSLDTAISSQALEITRLTLEELLEKMGITATVTTSVDKSQDDHGRLSTKADIHGKDLSILIGKNAETLNALQYITSLIVSKELGRAITLRLDVEGYRQRREQQLRQLAQRLADQAIKTGRKQALEPMPANERRIIHIELREHPQVRTESIGEEPHRKITIIPK
jgi:spoIIIJ-associated protein